MSGRGIRTCCIRAGLLDEGEQSIEGVQTSRSDVQIAQRLTIHQIRNGAIEHSSQRLDIVGLDAAPIASILPSSDCRLCDVELCGEL